jgi:hypothetical protein
VTRDRLLRHSTVFSIQGEGYRLKDKRRAAPASTSSTIGDNIR